MFFLYGILLTIAFIVLLPRFLFDAVFNGKYAAGFFQRLGFVPKFDAAGKKVIWLHCVSVGETNAARPLAFGIKKEFPDARLIVSTTTRTGQELAKNIFAEVADLVFYFPFDWKSTVRRSLRRLHPSVILLMETEIWFNFIRETSMSGARIAIVNGRLSERSLRRFAYIRQFMRRILSFLDLALVQEKIDATRLMSLGLRASKVRVTGNLKFDHHLNEQEAELTSEFRERFGITPDAPLIIAASTHAPEEQWITDAFKEVWKSSSEKLPRLMIAPRHPERFAEVAETLEKTGFTWARRSEPALLSDRSVEIILLDSIGELRAAYPLAEIVFVGGSLIPHGGQSVLEPAASARAIVIGPHTHNFDAVVTEFLARRALLQLPDVPEDSKWVEWLSETLGQLLENEDLRHELGENAASTIEAGIGATAETLKHLRPLVDSSK